VIEIHEIIDKAERELSESLDLHLVIHMDPISVETKEIAEARNEVENILKNIPSINSMHDFRVVGKEDKKTLIFDIVVDAYKLASSSTEEKLKTDICNAIKANNLQYNCIVTVDKEF